MESNPASSDSSAIIYSPTYEFSGKSCSLSPDGKQALYTKGKQVYVVNMESGLIEISILCSDRVDYAEWSPNSERILCCVRRSNSIEVFSVVNQEWNVAFQNEGTQLLAARWCADSISILSVSDYGLSTTIWSIFSKQCFLLPGISDLRKCCSFSRDGKWMAILHRKSINLSQQQDYVSLFLVENWKCAITFPISTIQAQTIAWTTNDLYIVVLDHSIHNQFFLYSLDGCQYYRYTGDSSQLGFDCVQCAKTLPILVTAGYGGRFSIMNTQELSILHELCVFSEMGSKETLVCREEPKQEVLERYRKKMNLKKGEIDEYEKTILNTAGPFFFEMETCIPTAAISSSVMNRFTTSNDIGIHHIRISYDDRLIAIKENSRPSMLWIWDIKRDRLLANLVFATPIIMFSWNPCCNKLVIISSNQTIYFWESESIVWSLLPNRIGGLKSIEWSSNGNSLLLVGSDSFQFCNV